MMVITLLSALALAVPAPGTPSRPVSDRHRIGAGPYIELWTSGDEVFRRGDRIRVYFRAADDAYVTIFRIDTDGRVRVLFPQEPWEDNFTRRDQRYEVRSYGDRHAFVVDDYPGQGYIFGVASQDPFNYANLVRGDHWDYRMLTASGGRITGDPYVALTDLVDQIIPENYAEYSYDILPYYVEQHYDYPRFLCYDCHSYASYSYWNPYSYNCFSFRIVIYDDPYYYPVRYHGQARIVYARSSRIAPRYVFKERASPAQQYVTRIRERPVDESGRRVLVDPGVTARDIGGVGRIPAPVGRRAINQGTGSALSTPERRTLTNPGATPSSDGRRTLTNPGTRSGDTRRTLTDPAGGDQGGRTVSDPPVADDRRRTIVEPRGGTGRTGSSGRALTDAERRGGRTVDPRQQLEPQDAPRRDDPPARVWPELRRRGESEGQPERPRPESRPEVREVVPRNEPRAEPRQVEPRREPDRQVQPSREPERRAEPRAEPRREGRQAPARPEANDEGEARRRPD